MDAEASVVANRITEVEIDNEEVLMNERARQVLAEAMVMPPSSPPQGHDDSVYEDAGENILGGTPLHAKGSTGVVDEARSPFRDLVNN